MERVVKQGQGWRIGWNPEASKYKGLVGNEHWAIELTEAELDDFCRLLGQLSQTMSEMSNELMEEERIACEAESDLIWMEVEGFPDAYSLRFILNSERRSEGYWPEIVVKALVEAAQNLKGF